MSSSSRKMLQAAAGVGGGDFYPYTVDYSARFNYADSSKLTRTPPTPTDNKKFTYSVWIKKSAIGPASTDTSFMLGAATDNTNYAHIHIQGDYFWYIDYNGSNTTSLRTYQKKLFRDVSAWYHVVVAVDTTQATSTDRVKIYFNGEQFTDWSTGTSSDTYPAQNYVTRINNTILQTIGTGAQPAYSAHYYSGYLAESAFVDGQQLPVTDFGEFKNGVWVPKNLSGLAFGNSGFYLDFSNSAALGTDVSGNGNNFTSSGLTSSDQMIDTPTNNFATINVLDGDSSATYSEGNLSINHGVTNSWRSYQSTISFDIADDYYMEVTADNITSGRIIVGIVEEGFSGKIVSASGNRFWSGEQTGTTGYGYYGENGYVYSSGSAVTTKSAYVTGDVIGVHVSNGSLTFYKNNVSQGVVASGLSGRWTFAVGIYTSGDDASVKFGQSGFTYTPPTGALALCTANLPEPTIGPNSATTSDENFNTVLYTGNGTTNAISGVGFQPDLVWLKNRNYGAGTNHVLIDAIRGASNGLASNLTNGVFPTTGNFSSINSDGFTVDGTTHDYNYTTDSFVAWNWKGNGSGVSNTDGSITSTVSANQDAGISIVKYTGNAVSGATIGHGLGVAPKVIIQKGNAALNWPVWFYDISYGTNNFIQLNLNNGTVTDSTFWTSTAPTSTVFSVGNSTHTNSSSYFSIAYCFAEVEGFSKFGKYTGNGSTDGPFVYTGFRPAFIITKRTDTSGYWWELVDTARAPYNPSDQTLYANVSDAEYTSSVYDKDLLSNGFKIRGTNAGHNASGGTYIFMAFAEMPFKYSVGR